VLDPIIANRPSFEINADPHELYHWPPKLALVEPSRPVGCFSGPLRNSLQATNIDRAFKRLHQEDLFVYRIAWPRFTCYDEGDRNGSDQTKIEDEAAVVGEKGQGNSASRLRKLSDFASYKARFHKSYRSPLAIFLANCRHVFASAVNYMYGWSSYYLAVNTMSDWLPNELASWLSYCESMPNHSLLVVGHGRQNGEEYWLLRNSFGKIRGESGYMKLNKNSVCIKRAYMYNGNGAKFNIRRNPNIKGRAEPIDECKKLGELTKLFRWKNQ
jgi:hypothetical protein